jgi:Histidine kinase-, DNA gyrase B-, and HSP90-like ATPase
MGSSSKSAGSRAASGTGLGLGLAIVAHLAQLIGGKISVESTLGEGTEFKVSLPYEADLPVNTAANRCHPPLWKRASESFECTSAQLLRAASTTSSATDGRGVAHARARTATPKAAPRFGGFGDHQPPSPVPIERGLMVTGGVATVLAFGGALRRVARSGAVTGYGQAGSSGGAAAALLTAGIVVRTG